MNIRLPVVALLGTCLAASTAMATSLKLHPMTCDGMTIPIYGFALNQAFVSSTSGTGAGKYPGAITVEVAISDLPSVLSFFQKERSACIINDSIKLTMVSPRLESYSASSNFEDTATTATAYAALNIYYANGELGAGAGSLAQSQVGGWNRVNNVTDLTMTASDAK